MLTNLGDPDTAHAEYTCHVVSQNDPFDYLRWIREGRLATYAKKKVLIAVLDTSSEKELNYEDWESIKINYFIWSWSGM